MKKALLCLGICGLVAAVVFGILWFTSDGKLFYDGHIIYDNSLSDEERTSLQNIFTDDIKFKNDITISATTESSKDLENNSLIYDILVPVANFYYAGSNIPSSELNSNSEVSLISIDDLTPEQKLLSLDGEYYLDEFTTGAKFRILHFDSITPEEGINIASEKLNKLSPSSDTTLSLAQTGVTAPSRGMNAKLASVGDASYFGVYIKDFLSSKDLAHTSNESSFSSFATSNNICANPGMINLLTSVGLDIIELTGNHNQDCGDDDAISTIDTYKSLGMETFGGGKTADEAAIPLQINQKNAKITMLGYNLSTGGYTTDDTPGANLYTDEKASADIADAKSRGDFVIIDIQYFECSEYDTTYENTTCDAATSVSGQQEFFRSLIDKGADIVIGTSAHQPQTFELYENKPIYYGLGNLFFDQSWWPGTTRSLILTHYFINGNYVQTRITPTVYDENYQTQIMDENTAKWFLERLNQAR